jgi:hypothetical protein
MLVAVLSFRAKCILGPSKYDGNNHKNKEMYTGLNFIKKMTNKPILVYYSNNHVTVPVPPLPSPDGRLM